jgi:hypothetical protein
MRSTQFYLGGGITPCIFVFVSGDQNVQMIVIMWITALWRGSSESAVIGTCCLPSDLIDLMCFPVAWHSGLIWVETPTMAFWLDLILFYLCQNGGSVECASVSWPLVLRYVWFRIFGMIRVPTFRHWTHWTFTVHWAYIQYSQSVYLGLYNIDCIFNSRCTVGHCNTSVSSHLQSSILTIDC